MSTAVESFQFQAETRQLLHLMIHSLYTEREVFLRELISNASDALDRLRFESLTKPELSGQDHKYEIHLKPDSTAHVLVISDTGIGMSRDELVANIGTIARSGTQELRKRIEEASSQQAFSDLIGQFGVGFYSAFMVAERVMIVTRRAGEETATQWESTGDGTYTLAACEKPGCGTDITLYLKKADPEGGIEDFTDRWKLSSIVKRYSDLIAYPVIFEGLVEQTDPQTGEEKGPPQIETKVLNSMKPIWVMRQSEVSQSDYFEFYKHIAHDWTEPLKVLPLKAEGVQEYDALLFVPAQAPHDLFYHGSEAGLRLYAKRVMVMEKCEDLLPRYLRFIKGVVDSSDLPLNISRQRLQQDRHIGQIKKWLTRKVLDALTEMHEKEEETYLKFWKQFGRAMKEGLSSDFDNKQKIVSLLLFESSHDPEKLTTLKQYAERMKPEQKEILYLTGESRNVIENSPHLEAVSAKGYEVLYLSDPVDELMVQHLYDFEEKKLKSINKGTMELGSEEERTQAQEQLKTKKEEFAGLLEMSQKKLDEHVKQVRLSTRLVNFPACLVTEEHEYSPHLEKLLQKGKGGGPKQRRILELNAGHAIVTRLQGRFLANPEDAEIGNTVELLFALALLAEGSEIPDPVRFNRLTLDLMEKTLQS
ncbi:MAG TPA: molecular chaperone HtpG [Candidatus Saccharimonadales bacterium]|jgi:molecular chaperone HtpG|nr:molecular chaperone HtpG [Candidatus Saccharimonadales bacterium]